MLWHLQKSRAQLTAPPGRQPWPNQMGLELSLPSACRPASQPASPYLQEPAARIKLLQLRPVEGAGVGLGLGRKDVLHICGSGELLIVHQKRHPVSTGGRRRERESALVQSPGRRLFWENQSGYRIPPPPPALPQYSCFQP